MVGLIDSHFHLDMYKKYDEIFKPHGSQYTNSEKQNPEDNKGGRPADSNNKVKQQYDKTRQEALQ